jgi:hypothetical protein
LLIKAGEDEIIPDNIEMGRINGIKVKAGQLQQNNNK